MSFKATLGNTGGLPVTFTATIEGVDGFGRVTVNPGEEQVAGIDLGALPFRRITEGPVKVAVFADGNLVAEEMVDVTCLLGSDNECPPVDQAGSGNEPASPADSGFPWLPFIGGVLGAGALGAVAGRRFLCSCTDEDAETDDSGEAPEATVAAAPGI
jgi:hypothetical protein